jgi:hypothetical protein
MLQNGQWRGCPRQDLVRASAGGAGVKLLVQPQRPTLDEIGSIPIDRHGANLLFVHLIAVARKNDAILPTSTVIR